MTQLKKVLISMSETLIKEVDEVITEEETSRSKFVRDAIEFYLAEKKRRKLREQMIDGYRQMGDLNLSIAAEWEAADEKQLRDYEEKLSECE